MKNTQENRDKFAEDITSFLQEKYSELVPEIKFDIEEGEELGEFTIRPYIEYVKISFKIKENNDM